VVIFIKQIITEISENYFKIEPTDISLKDTFECGQCFRWDADENGYVGVVRRKAVRMIQGDGCIYIKNTTREDIANLWIPYLSLDVDYSSVPKLYPDDEYLRKAFDFGKGIRILRQDKCEALLSFIISSNNNISRIKKIITSFCKLYGSPIQFENTVLYSFPDEESLPSFTEEGLASIRAGFRDKYLMDAALKMISGEIKLDYISSLSTEDARNELMKIKGVGPKVSDCVLLFGFGRGDVFPKDVWIKRVLSEVYGDGFDETVFGENAGIIQQWLFHYARNGEKRQ